MNLDQLLAGSSFTPPPPLRPRLVLEVAGGDKTGKDRFAFTAPAPILVQSLDFGTEGVVQQFPNKVIRVAEYKRPPIKDKKDASTIKADFMPLIEKWEADFGVALKMDRGTIVWDTDTELWEVAQLAHHGKVASVPPLHRSVSNGWYHELVRRATHSNVNLILLRQIKDEWENYEEGGEKKSRTTGRQLPHGNEKTQYLVQGRLRTRRIPASLGRTGAFGVVIEPATPQRFELEFVAIRHNADLNGLVLADKDINFPMVASLIAPSVPAEAWQ